MIIKDNGTEVVTVATMLWDINEQTWAASRCFDETWVDKLCRAFQRNLTVPHRFVVYVDRLRTFVEPGIMQRMIRAERPHYGCYIEPFAANEPMILVGLDTLVVGNVDRLAAYCLMGDKTALPRDPYVPTRTINAVALIPRGQRFIYDEWDGATDSMEWLRKYKVNIIDNLFPGQVISLKFHKVREKGAQGARIVYLHGTPKQHVLGKMKLIQEHWK